MRIEQVFDPAEQFETVANVDCGAQINQFIAIQPDAIGCVIPAWADQPEISAQFQPERAFPIGKHRAEMPWPPRQIEVVGAIFRIDKGIDARQAETGKQIKACLRLNPLGAGTGRIVIGAKGTVGANRIA